MMKLATKREVTLWWARWEVVFSTSSWI